MRPLRDEGESIGKQVIELETADLTVSLFPAIFPTRDKAIIELGFIETETPEHPARVRATIRNDSDYEKVFETADLAPFAPKTVANLPDHAHHTRWYLVPTAGSGIVDETPEYERGPRGHWRLSAQPERWLPDRRRLAPHQTVTGEFLLLGHSESTEYLPGIYRFTKEPKRLSLAVWRTSRPGPVQDSIFEGESFPPLPYCDNVRWYHEATARSPVYVEPSVERTELPAQIDLTLVNHSHSYIEGGPTAQFHILHDGTWVEIPQTRRATCQWLAPGDEKSYTVRLPPTPGLSDRGRSYGPIGDATYAISTFRVEGEPIAAIIKLDRL